MSILSSCSAILRPDCELSVALRAKGIWNCECIFLNSLHSWACLLTILTILSYEEILNWCTKSETVSVGFFDFPTYFSKILAACHVQYTVVKLPDEVTSFMCLPPQLWGVNCIYWRYDFDLLATDLKIIVCWFEIIPGRKTYILSVPVWFKIHFLQPCTLYV